MYRLLFFLSLLLATSCTEKIGQDGSSALIEGKKRVTIGVSQSNTRTSLDPDGYTTRWSIGDKIAVWAKAETDYVLTAEPFELYSYNGVFSSADFSATITPMASGTYTYYASYPTPKSVVGTTATYSLSAIQSGAYDGANDILVASPVSGKQLDENPREELLLAFRHLLHMIKIEIPKGRNLLGEPIKKLEISFPTEVVGDISFDLTNPEASYTLSNGSRNITLNFEGEGLTDTEGLCAYIFVSPCEMDGQISFRAYNTSGYQAKLISSNVTKTMLADHVTPISLTIPTPRPLTYLDFKVGVNNLGETLTAIHLTAPEEIRFAVPFSSESSASVSAISKDGIFNVAIYADQYPSSNLTDKTLTISYESANALVTEKSVTTPSSILDGEHNQVTVTVPYLYEEDFSGVEAFSRDDNRSTGSTSAGSSEGGNISPPGWTGARVGGDAGKAIRICCRGEQAVWVAGSYTGRADSPNMSSIKEGKSLNLEISFNYSLNRKSSKDRANQHYFAIGTHTSSGPQNSTVSGVGKLGSGIADNTHAKDIYSPNEGNFDRIDKQASYTFQGCSSANRFVWEAYIKTKCPDGYYNNWVYIDNIKVKIVQ